MSESVVIVQAGHRGVVLYVGAVANATGEAQAISLITEQLRQSPQYLQWKAINEWNGNLPYSLGGGNSSSGGFPFLQLPRQR